jgi:predicted membrane protein
MRKLNKLSALPSVAWLTRSLPGNVIVFVVAMVVIFYSLMAALIYSEGDLSLWWALYMLGLCIVGGVIVGILFWFAGTRPFLMHIERLQNEKRNHKWYRW